VEQLPLLVLGVLLAHYKQLPASPSNEAMLTDPSYCLPDFHQIDFRSTSPGLMMGFG
jgi:hypothetical protein